LRLYHHDVTDDQSMQKPLFPVDGAIGVDRANDDIGEEMRLRLFRTQVELREAEQRAYDLFLQNLVKGTSHLSLGQEAIAAGFASAMKPGDLSFCTYRGHAHTLARGVPV
jgi:acetoin:2,6-dichlorophenolindophenol oxidoreductase subunit alpha